VEIAADLGTASEAEDEGGEKEKRARFHGTMESGGMALKLQQNEKEKTDFRTKWRERRFLSKIRFPNSAIV
jgi:hypothetical protein